MTFPAGHGPDFDAAPPGRENDSYPILQLPATVDQLTRCPSLLINQLGQFPQLRPVAARPSISANPLPAFKRLWPGGVGPWLKPF